MKSGRFYGSNTVPYLAIRLHNNGNRVVNIRDLVRPLARSKNIEAVSLHSNYDFQQSKIASQHAYQIFYLGILTPFSMSKGDELWSLPLLKWLEMEGFNLKVKMRAYLPIKLKLLHCSQSHLPSLLHFGMKWAPFPELLLHSFSSLSQGDDYFSHCSHVKEMQKTRDIFQLRFVEVIYFFLFGLFILGTFIFGLSWLSWKALRPLKHVIATLL